MSAATMTHFQITGTFYAESIEDALAKLRDHFAATLESGSASPLLGAPYTFDVSPIPDDAP
jgi:hypothetical protein